MIQQDIERQVRKESASWLVALVAKDWFPEVLQDFIGYLLLLLGLLIHIRSLVHFRSFSNCCGALSPLMRASSSGLFLFSSSLATHGLFVESSVKPLPCENIFSLPFLFFFFFFLTIFRFSVFSFLSFSLFFVSFVCYFSFFLFYYFFFLFLFSSSLSFIVFFLFLFLSFYLFACLLSFFVFLYFFAFHYFSFFREVDSSGTFSG